jgi:hypothetical protein
MSTSSERLAKALQALPYVQIIQHDQQGTAVNVMCRVRPANAEQWANLAHEVLLTAQQSSNTWDAHISRSYVLKDGDLRYAWNFIIVGRTPEAVHAIVADAVIPLIRRRLAVRSVPEDIQKAPLRRRPAHPPEADSKGNPIVPEEDRVDSVPMAGFEPDADRNAPDNGKGAWHIGGKSGGSFVPASVKRKG